MIRFAPTHIIDIAPLSSGGAAAIDRAVAEALADHGNFVATGFAGTEGFGGRIAGLLSLFSMEEAHKLECATCRHGPRNPNMYRGFCPFPQGRSRSNGGGGAGLDRRSFARPSVRATGVRSRPKRSRPLLRGFCPEPITAHAE